MRNRSRLWLISFGLLFLPASCSYTLTMTEGTKVTSAQIQQIKLGRTTEIHLLQILGPPNRKERTISGNDRLVYESTDVKSLTFPGGYQARGLLDKEEDEAFEVLLKDGVVQSYRFVKP